MTERFQRGGEVFISQSGKSPLGACRLLLASAAVLLSCRSGERAPEPARPEIVVAAAANLTDAFQQIAEGFTRETGIGVRYNFGATTQLMQQIENGAPFDVFAAADTVHVDRLVESGKILADSRAVYARGRLALWVPESGPAAVSDLSDLLQPSVRFVAIANPEIAPYGAAAVEALERRNLWRELEPKIVRAENVNAARQLAATGNADAVFTAYSLVLNAAGRVILIDESLHAPLDQALGVVAAASQQERARRFTSYVLGEQGRAFLARFGYDPPPAP
jgi:molybdate transport system substrate-binding protein